MDSAKDLSGDVIKAPDTVDNEKFKRNVSPRRVLFELPSESEDTVSAGLVKSLDSGLSETKGNRIKKKSKKHYLKRAKGLAADTVSWPSDSDITVLRMKCMPQNDNNFTNLLPGDGLHHSDSSSMVNLATLIKPTKKEDCMKEDKTEDDECLMQLTSWEGLETKEPLDQIVELKPKCEDRMLGSDFVYDKPFYGEYAHSRASGEYPLDRRSKIARFLRLYFCPCCSCLYQMETMNNNFPVPSSRGEGNNYLAYPTLMN